MSLKTTGREGWSVAPPSYRSDVTQEADLIEEVARLRGYEAIPTILPRSEMQEKMPDVEGVLGRRIRTVFSMQGLAEMLNMSFTAARLNAFFPGLFAEATPISLLNPLSLEDAEMRLSLLSNIVRALQLNLRQGETHVEAFELGKVFHKKNGASGSTKNIFCVSGLLYGKRPVSGIDK
jgi:phenylalanyl-tRNA synthetase beta chain